MQTIIETKYDDFIILQPVDMSTGKFLELDSPFYSGDFLYNNYLIIPLALEQHFNLLMYNVNKTYIDSLKGMTPSNAILLLQPIIEYCNVMLQADLGSEMLKQFYVNDVNSAGKYNSKMSFEFARFGENLKRGICIFANDVWLAQFNADLAQAKTNVKNIIANNQEIKATLAEIEKLNKGFMSNYKKAEYLEEYYGDAYDSKYQEAQEAIYENIKTNTANTLGFINFNRSMVHEFDVVNYMIDQLKQELDDKVIELTGEENDNITSLTFIEQMVLYFSNTHNKPNSFAALKYIQTTLSTVLAIVNAGLAEGKSVTWAIKRSYVPQTHAQQHQAEIKAQEEKEAKEKAKAKQVVSNVFGKKNTQSESQKKGFFSVASESAKQKAAAEAGIGGWLRKIFS